jgi:hypothetical protein
MGGGEAEVQNRYIRTTIPTLRYPHALRLLAGVHAFEKFLDVDRAQVLGER